MDLGPVTLVIFQDTIRGYGQRVAVVNIRITVHRDHVRPFLEVFLTCRGEFMLGVHRPAMPVTDAAKSERRLGRWWVLCEDCAAGERKER